MLRFGKILPVAAIIIALLAQGQQKPLPAGKGYTLTVIVDGVNNQDGNIGVLLFNSAKGWPEDQSAALRNVVVPAHAGTVRVVISGLPAGTYALAIGHDANKNGKIDRNWLGAPKEQWGMSNNPRAMIKAPSFDKARFSLQHDAEIHVQLQ